MLDHPDLEVIPAGFILSKEYPSLRVSLDTYVFCSNCGDGIVEVQCPYKFCEHSIEDMIKYKESCLNHEWTLKNHKWYDQMQHQLFVSGRHYCDLVVYSSVETHLADWVARAIPVAKVFMERQVLLRLLLLDNVQIQEPSTAGASNHHCS